MSRMRGRSGWGHRTREQRAVQPRAPAEPTISEPRVFFSHAWPERPAAQSPTASAATTIVDYQDLYEVDIRIHEQVEKD